MPAKADESERKDEEGDDEQADDFEAITATLARLQFQVAVLRAQEIRALRRRGHSFILRRSCWHVAPSSRSAVLPTSTSAG